MGASPHYRELLRALNEAEAEYLIVGGYALMKYTEPYFTKDLDLWVRNSPSNAEKVFRALAAFGAPLAKDGINAATFTDPTIVYQIGVAPVRIDVSTHIDGVSFEAAWQRRVGASVFGEQAHFISLDDLIANKEASGRTSDLAHLDVIRRHLKR